MATSASRAATLGGRFGKGRSPPPSYATALRLAGGRNSGITRSAKSLKLCIVFSCP